MANGISKGKRHALESAALKAGVAPGAAFRLGALHDQLISYGSLPVSIIEWLMLDDSTAVTAASR
jgi:hypothetical protein